MSQQHDQAGQSDGSLDEANWHVWAPGSEDTVGPVSVRQIANGIRAGVVPTDARVQQSGEVWWSDVLAEPKVVEALKSV